MPRCARLLCLFVCLYLPACLVRADVPPVTLFGSLPQNLFVTSMCRGLDGAIWVGTEDNGVYRIQPGNKITQFTSKDGIGQDNDIYALCCDRLGRIWAGTLRSGVAVYNGKEWKTYGPLEGPLGSRVFALTISPLDGNVWISTEAGLARYSEKRQEAIGTRHENSGTRIEVRRKSKTSSTLKSHPLPTLDSGLSTLDSSPWRYYTRAEGLPSDQTQALVFGPDGTLYVGTQCDGIAIGNPKDNYRAWKVVMGSEKLPLANAGEGLPSNLINCLLVSKKGRVYAGTTAGLAWSDDQGSHWKYLRGYDWKAKVDGLYVPDGDKKPVPVEAEHPGDLLLEDYITCLAESPDGKLWIGHRQKVIEIKNQNTFYRDIDIPNKDSYMMAFLILPESGMAIGQYGEGVDLIISTQEKRVAHINPLHKSAFNVYSLPEPSPLPTLLELRSTLLELLRKKPENIDAPPVIMAATDDWLTRGDVLDHYGWGMLTCSAMGGHGDATIIPYIRDYIYKMATQPWLGRNGSKDDYLRYYVTEWHTNNDKSLQSFYDAGHKQSEWDDHGETKPMTLDGPGVYCSIMLPKGKFYISVYFYNKDGHQGPNRWRDFILQLKRTPMTYKRFSRLGVDYSIDTQNAQDIYDGNPIGASLRIKDFCGTVWKRFYIEIKDEREYVTLGILRNNSFNTICSGVAVDEAGSIDENEGTGLCPHFPKYETNIEPPETVDTTNMALRIMDRLLCMKDTNPRFLCLDGRRFFLTAIRTLVKKNLQGECLAGKFESGKYLRGLRRDIAESLAFVGMHEKSDRVFADNRKDWQYHWKEMTEDALKSNYTGDYRRRSSDHYYRFLDYLTLHNTLDWPF